MKLELLLAAPLFAFCLGLAGCVGPVPVDVVMDGGEIYFVLEAEHSVSALRVASRPVAEGKPVTLWELRHDTSTPIKQRKYPELKVIKYGAQFAEFPLVKGPAELSRNTEYVVALDLGDKFAKETFLITAEGKVVMPNPAFQRQRGRAYTVLTDKDGNKTFTIK